MLGVFTNTYLTQKAFLRQRRNSFFIHRGWLLCRWKVDSVFKTANTVWGGSRRKNKENKILTNLKDSFFIL